MGFTQMERDGSQAQSVSGLWANLGCGELQIWPLKYRFGDF